jgi:hypothetical protein
VSVLSDKITSHVPRRPGAAGQHVEVWSEGAYVRLHIRGGYDPASAVALLALIRAAAQHYACQRFLIDISSVIGDGSTPDQFGIRRVAAKLLPSLCVAIVASEEVTGTFGETVAVDRGANLQAFSTESGALVWLLRPASA